MKIDGYSEFNALQYYSTVVAATVADQFRKVVIFDPSGRRVEHHSGLENTPEWRSLWEAIGPILGPLPDEFRRRVIMRDAAFVCIYPQPPGDAGASAWAFDTRRNVVVILDRLSRTLEWDGVSWNSRAIAAPPDRSLAGMAYDDARGVCVLFGGTTGGTLTLNDLWEYDGVNGWVQRQQFDPNNSTNRPPPTPSPLMAYDSFQKRTVLVLSSDTWEWDGTNWFHHAGGPGLTGSAMAYDPARQAMVLFGGSNETWTWKGTKWTKVAVEGPGQRKRHAMAFDVSRQVVVLFGGEGASGEVFGDTWEWDGASWSLVPDAGRFGTVHPRYESKLWYDNRVARRVLFGGFIHTDSGSIVRVWDMWESRPRGYWVDFNAPGSPSVPETGYFHEPFNTLSEAIHSATPGCTINLTAGSTPEVFTISKPLTLDAYYGPVTIGQP